MAVKDMNARQLLAPLGNGKYIPTSDSSLNAHSIATILNDILINQRASILELGSGISTLYIARLIKSKAIKAKVLSVDSNAAWLSILEEQLTSEGLRELVSLVHAPLTGKAEDTLLPWYCQSSLSEALKKVPPLDLVLVDGPIACDKKRMLARLPAFGFLTPHLASRFAFYLDDTHRDGEKKCMEQWQRKYHVRFQKINPVCSACWNGDRFNPIAG